MLPALHGRIPHQQRALRARRSDDRRACLLQGRAPHTNRQAQKIHHHRRPHEAQRTHPQRAVPLRRSKTRLRKRTGNAVEARRLHRRQARNNHRILPHGPRLQNAPHPPRIRHVRRLLLLPHSLPRRRRRRTRQAPVLPGRPHKTHSGTPRDTERRRNAGIRRRAPTQTQPLHVARKAQDHTLRILRPLRAGRSRQTPDRENNRTQRRQIHARSRSLRRRHKNVAPQPGPLGKSNRAQRVCRRDEKRNRGDERAVRGKTGNPEQRNKHLISLKSKDTRARDEHILAQ